MITSPENQNLRIAPKRISSAAAMQEPGRW